MSWIIYLLLFLLMVFLIMRSRFFHLPGLHRSFPLLFFIVKVIASFAVWWIYTHHYPDRKTADIWKYFDDGNVMYSSLKDHPGDYFRMLSGIGDDVPSVGKYYHEMDHWYQQFDNHLLNDAHFMIRLNAVFRIFSLGNYHIHSLLFCFLAFIGLCALFKTFYAFLSEWKFALAAIIFFFPSLVFWTSSVLKESVMIFALGIFLYQLFKFRDDRKILRALPVLFSILLLFLTKFYLLAALVPATTGLMLTWNDPSRALLKYSVILLLCIAGALSIRCISPSHDPLKVLALKQRDFVNVGTGGTRLYNDSVVVFIKGDPGEHIQKINDTTYTIDPGTDYMFWYHYPDFSDTVFVKNSNDRATYKLLNQQVAAGSLMQTEILQPTITSFLIATPSGMVHALFRPFPWEGKNLLLLLPAAENLLLIILLLLAIIYRRKPSSPQVTIFLLCFSLLLLWLMGVTTPVLGALVRYRIAAFPFLLLALLMCIDKKRISRSKTAGVS